MIYFGLSAALVIFIYFNVLGLFRGYKEIPDGPYKEKLWKYKKQEIMEKAVICLLFIGIIFSMKYCEEIALIALGAMFIMLAIEHVFARHIRKSLTCPHCGGPVWSGTYIVLLQARKNCPWCKKPLSAEKDECTVCQTEESTNHEEQ